MDFEKVVLQKPAYDNCKDCEKMHKYFLIVNGEEIGHEMWGYSYWKQFFCR